MPREWAEAVVEAINDIGWLMDRCHACGHRLRFASTGCPQCGADSIAPWFTPSEFPELCECERCQKARANGGYGPSKPLLEPETGKEK
jgi:predicted RNA-binding Zn-ribbon protein involved in translation (DUF1610 family)